MCVFTPESCCLWTLDKYRHGRLEDVLALSPPVPTEKMKVEGHFGNDTPHLLGLCSVSFRVRTGKTRNKFMKRERSRECKIIIVLWHQWSRTTLQASVLFQVAWLCLTALGAGVHLLFGYLCREHSQLPSFPPLHLDDSFNLGGLAPLN